MMIKKIENVLEERLNPVKHWEVLDYFIFPDGTKELVQPVSHNVVTERLSIAIACLMKREPGYDGILYWALGSGSPSWSEDNPPSPSDTDTGLQNEFYRKEIPTANKVFIDSDNNVSHTPTNRVQASITFNEDEANGKIMEFGIFAGTATSSLGTGLMINHKIHPAIYKSELVRLEKVIRFTF